VQPRYGTTSGSAPPSFQLTLDVGDGILGIPRLGSALVVRQAVCITARRAASGSSAGMNLSAG
jgi:hypothetical protein